MSIRLTLKLECAGVKRVTGTAVSQVAKLLAIGTCCARLAQAMEGP